MAARFFCDETDLALGKALEETHGEDIVYPGHAGLPEVPRGTNDEGRSSRTRSIRRQLSSRIATLSAVDWLPRPVSTNDARFWKAIRTVHSVLLGPLSVV